MRDAISSYFFSNTKQNSNSPQNWDSAFHYLYNSNDNLFMSIPNIKIEAPIDEPIFNNNTPLEQKNGKKQTVILSFSLPNIPSSTT